MTDPLLSSGAVMAALRNRFPKQEYALFEDVANGTGSRVTRRADALAMSLWPSRGLHFHGFEIKVSRTDVLRELKDPSKAEAIAAYCDYWWLVVGDPKIVKLEEVPATWGLMVPQGKGKALTLRALKPAMKMKAKPISLPFLAAILRKASSFTESAESRIRDRVYQEVAELAKANVKKERDCQEESAIRTIEDLEKRCADLTADVMSLTDEKFRPETIGIALDLVRRLSGWSGVPQRADSAARSLAMMSKDLQEMEATMQGVATLAKALREQEDPSAPDSEDDHLRRGPGPYSKDDEL